jgi:hypothetical protein
VTTIAYKDGIMAADSGLYDDSWGIYYGEVDKIHILRDGSLLGLAGDGDNRALIALLDAKGSGATPDDLIETGVDASGMLVEPDGSVFYVDVTIPRTMKQRPSGSLVKVKHTHYAVGIGYQVAMGAMQAGKSAEDAIKDTVPVNVFTRAPVHVVKLNDDSE